MRIPAFDDELLRSLCAILGATNEGLTNAEIDQLLSNAKIEDPHAKKYPKNPYVYYPITKRDRLYQALSQRQLQDQCGNNVVNFLLMALSPVRFVQNRPKYDFLLSEANKVLSFSGLEIGEDGKLRTTNRVETLSEAEQRASKLRYKLIERDAHPDVLEFCKAELIQDNYFHAVLEATKSVADKIRRKGKIDLDGSHLIDEAFSFKKEKVPRLAFNSLQTVTEQMEHRGLMNLLKGMFGTFRNVTAHAPKITWVMSEHDALDLLSLASFLHRRIDACRVLK